MEQKDKKLITESSMNSENFRKDFLSLINLSSDQLDAIAELSNSESGFSYTAISPKLGGEITNLDGILDIISFLYDRIVQSDIKLDPAIQEIIHFASEFLHKDISNKANSLSNLFGIKKAYEPRRLEEKAHYGIPNLSRIVGYCDTRAVFDRDNNLIEQVPIVMLTLYPEDDYNNRSQVSIQLTKETWLEFMSYLDRLNLRFNKVIDSIQKV